MRNPEVVGAILVGSALVAAALFFGLRSRTTEAPSGGSASARADVPAPTPRQTDTTAPAHPPAAAQVGPGLAAVDAALAAKVQKATAQAIEAARPELRKQCWEKLPQSPTTVPKAKLTFNATMGPNGKPTAFGISEDREAVRPGVSDCVSRELANLTIADAPKQPVEVTVPFELP